MDHNPTTHNYTQRDRETTTSQRSLIFIKMPMKSFSAVRVSSQKSVATSNATGGLCAATRFRCCQSGFAWASLLYISSPCRFKKGLAEKAPTKMSSSLACLSSLTVKR